MSKLKDIASYAKFIAALIGAFAVSFTGLVPAEWQPWFTAIAAFLTAVAVLLVPNRPTAAVDAAAEDGPKPSAG